MPKQTISRRSDTPLYLLTEKAYKSWLKKQPVTQQRWLKASGFEAKAHSYALVPDSKGNIAKVVIGAGDAIDMWSLADMSTKLPKGKYSLANDTEIDDVTALYLGYLLGRYQFSEHQKTTTPPATLLQPKGVDGDAKRLVESLSLARDLINSPANILTPQALAAKAKEVARTYQARIKVTTGRILEKEYPAVHTVGKASDTPPALIDLSWGDASDPKVTLVGKGVTFDSGGLDIKSSAGMRLMKKDMGGAAVALATAQAIMDAKLPIRLRLLIPTVENAISGNAMRPSDVIQTRKGLSVEVGNTDAEGRLILCDALYEADEEMPDLLIDFATLTGAARVALGTDVPAFFTNNDATAAALEAASDDMQDPIWRLPLVENYAKKLKSDIADISNDAGTGYGGAITAALFLKRFVAKTKNWVHIDLMAWNTESRPGRPKGGEAQAVRAIYQLIKTKYTQDEG